MNSRSSQDFLLPGSPSASIGSRLSVSRDSETGGTSMESLEQVAVISVDESHSQ
jgi:hypothetical protein